jgi:hypothetical protein
LGWPSLESVADHTHEGITVAGKWQLW